MVRTWSTAGVPAPRQFGYWREAICAAFLDLTPESPLRGAFRGEVVQHDLGPFELARITSQAQRVERRPQDVDRAPGDGYYVNLQVAGSGLVAQGGRVATLRPGDLALVDTTAPFTLAFDRDFAQLSLHVPKPLLDRELSAPLVTATTVAAGPGVNAALRSALHALQQGDLPAHVAARLAVHAGGLLALALEHAAAAAERPPSADPARRSLLDLALADIDARLASPDLTPGSTARRLGISVRRLHGLFAGQERSYAREVRWRRLALAHRRLLDPGWDHLRVIDIAVETGFPDVTHFHRVFRRRYGCTPAEVRHRWTASPDSVLGSRPACEVHP